MKAMIFDADGTLLDSLGLWREIDRKFLSSHGLLYSEAVSRAVQNMSLDESSAFFCALLRDKEDLTPASVRRELNILCETAYERDIKPMPYVREFLSCAKNDGFMLCVATETNKVLIEKALRRLGLAGYFEFFMDTEEAGFSKNSPEIFFKCASLLAAPPEECYVFEDSPRAAESAASAGFKVVFIENDLSLPQKKFYLSINSFSQLISAGSGGIML